jgi:crossover junction endodeoxyribonuclease RuvC
MVILGIDPGLNVTGYGAITTSGRQLHCLTAGDIRPPHAQPLSQRLKFLHDALTDLIARQHPDTIVLEMVFTHSRYVSTAAKMAHARGVACLVAEQHGVTLVEYPPARVKKALTGRGAASKDQVARMVVQWIGTSDPSWSFDATDALALAIAHAHMKNQLWIADCRSRISRRRQSEIRNPKSEILLGLDGSK